MDFAEYERAYQGYFIDQLPAEAMPDGLRREFFAQAHELLDWTAEEPDAESRRYGWRDRGEYLDWLRAGRATWSRDFGSRVIPRG